MQYHSNSLLFPIFPLYPLAAGGSKVKERKSQGGLLRILEKCINPGIMACEKFNVKGLTLFIYYVILLFFMFAVPVWN